MIKNSIILCTHNEGKYIKETILSLKEKIEDLEIIIIDDNSNDNTLEEIEKLKISINIKLIIRKKTSGLGSAFLRGIIESIGENVGWIDANMGEVSDKFQTMITALEQNDIVILSRYTEGGGDKRELIRIYCSKAINLLCRLVLSNKIRDFTSSIFIMKRKVLNETSFLGYGHGDFFIEFLYHALKKNFKIKEIPYIQNQDKDLNNSKTASNILLFFYNGLFYIIRILITRLRRN